MMLFQMNRISVCLHLIPFLLALSGNRVAEGKKCLNITDVHPRYAHSKNQVVNLTIATTDRISHQLTTFAFKIILEEILGYRNVKVLYFEDHYDATNYFDIKNLPWSINLEVWTPSDSNIAILLDHFHLRDYGNIGPTGKFGWFIPKITFRSKDVDVHWTIFQNPKLASRFGMDKKYWDYVVSNSVVDNSAMLSEVCTECVNGTFIPYQCENAVDKCAVLLAPKLSDTSFIIEQIKKLNMSVQVVWVGARLNEISQYLTNQYVISNYNRSILILGSTPSEVIFPENNFTTVSFPSCAVLSEQYNMSVHDCKYDKIRLVKLVDNQIKINGPLTRLLLLDMNIDYNTLFEYYHNSSKYLTIEEIACDWVRDSPIVSNFLRRERQWQTDDRQVIVIGGIFPLTGNTSLRTTAPGIKDAAIMAVDDINRSNIIKDYQLKLTLHNGQCESNHVMKAFIDILRYDYYLGILGPACSETVEPLAGVLKLYNTLTISYSAEGVSFADRTKYPYFFRTIGENQHYVPVYMKFFKAMDWKRIFALTEDGHKYTEYLSHMSDLLENKKFPRDREPDDMKKYLQDLQRKRARVIIVDVPDEVARSVMCEAYNLNMTGRDGYVWFLPNWFSDDWFNTTDYNRKKNETVSCTTEMMIEAINGYFTLSHAFFAPNDSVMSINNNMTVGEWRHLYETRCNLSRKYSIDSCNVTSNYAGYAYDAMWTYALALEKLLGAVPDAVSTLHSENITKKLVEYVKATDFNGVSGHIKFGNGASRYSVINIKQWINKTTHLIGSYYPNITDINRPNINNGILDLNQSSVVWLLGRKPKDGTEPLDTCLVAGFAAFLNVQCHVAIIIINVLGLTSLLMLLGVVIFIFKRKYEQKIKEHNQLMSRKFGLDLVKLNTLDKWEIPRENVVINRKLGQGAFGTVYGGEAYFVEKGWMGVAVKTLKIGSTTEEKLDFLSEAEIMKRFDHKNIVKLLGVCTQNEPVYTIMEFMLYGDLKTFLLARRHLINERSFEENDEISSKKLTSMALDVARALSYLAEMKFVHRDVACRNCLLNAQRMVKLGDFGMTRPMFENDYYKFNRRGMLPVRWMAPESLVFGKFTPSSDVWSYGVLLYEIITFGSFPFQGKTNTEVLEYVKEGNVLTIPSGVKPQLEALIKSCWTLDPKRRPQASQIVEFLANAPRLISPCLDAPLSSVEMCNTNSNEENECADDVPLPEAFRKYSVRHLDPLSRQHSFIRQHSVSSAVLSEETASVPSASNSIQLDSYVREPLLSSTSNIFRLGTTDMHQLQDDNIDYILDNGYSSQADTLL